MTLPIILSRLVLLICRPQFCSSIDALTFESLHVLKSAPEPWSHRPSTRALNLSSKIALTFSLGVKGVISGSSSLAFSLDCRNLIAMPLMPAVLTLKPVPVSVCSINVTASRTGLGSIGRVHVLSTATCRRRLKLDSFRGASNASTSRFDVTSVYFSLCAGGRVSRRRSLRAVVFPETPRWRD